MPASLFGDHRRHFPTVGLPIRLSHPAIRQGHILNSNTRSQMAPVSLPEPADMLCVHMCVCSHLCMWDGAAAEVTTRLTYTNECKPHPTTPCRALVITHLLQRRRDGGPEGPRGLPKATALVRKQQDSSQSLTPKVGPSSVEPRLSWIVKLLP